MIEIAVLVLAGLGIAILYLTLCFNRNIWTDEAFTVDLLKNYKTLGEIADYTATDVHPPLYYFILKIVTDVFGVHWTLIKMVSILPVFGVYVLGATYVRKRFGFGTALLFILLTAAIPCSMEYAVQMRMYSFCMFFVTGSAFAAWDAYETGRIRSFLGLLVCGLGAAYSQYFAFAGILWVHGILFIALLVRTLQKKAPRRALLYYGLTAVLSVLLYLPWLSKFMGQISGVSNSYWIPEITWEVFCEYFTWIFRGDYPSVIWMCQLLFGGAILWMLLSLGRRLVRKLAKKEAAADTVLMPALLALLIPCLVIATGVTLSKFIRPIFIIRYVMPCIPLLCFATACVLQKVRRDVYVMLLIFLVFLTSLSYKTNYRMEYEATCTDKTLAFLQEHVGENDIILYNYRIYDFIYACYFPEDKLVYIEDLTYDEGYDHMWFLQTVYNPNLDPARMQENGLVSVYQGDYGIEQNEFWIWDVYHETIAE